MIWIYAMKRKIWGEKDRYEMMKENLKNKNGESYEIIRFNSVKSEN